jgi:DNA-binding response OmpR family regulator
MSEALAKLDGKRVLVVEDDYLIAMGLGRSFEDEGAEVLGPVGRVETALELIARETSIDGAVLDINLAGDLVFPVADALFARGVPFVFSTGYDADAVPAPYREVPRYRKPVLPRSVRDALFA